MTGSFTGRRVAGLTLAAFVLSGCEAMSPEKPELEELDVIAATELTDVMLSLRDPMEAAAYFRDKLAREPENIKYLRGLASSLTRANRPREAALAYDKLIDTGQATDADRLTYAEALIKGGDIKNAEVQLNAITPTVETYKRYLLEAIVADHNEDWTRSDSYYKTARGLTARPAAVLNNWGMSKLARGQTTEAANLFQEAITFDPTMFSAKNNLVTARARTRLYRLPVIPMDEAEEAQLLYNVGIIAVRQGDVDVGKGLFETAVDTHPEHFPEAQQALAQLDGTVNR